MLIIFFRTLIIFSTLVLIIRLMGKRQIGEMQPFEFIVTLIIADLACIPMSDVSIPLVYGIVSIICLFLLHQLFSVIEQSSKLLKRIISGKASLVINKNGVDLKELKRNNLNLEDLIESMRAGGYFSFDDLSYAIYESNGKLSALENPDKKVDSPSLPLLIVNDGKFDSSNASVAKINKEQLEKFIKSSGGSLKKTEVLTIDGNGRIYYQAKNQKFQILQYPLISEGLW